MHGIGNEHDAQAIARWVRSSGKGEYGRPMCVSYGEAPEGWEYLGSGSFRSVWLSPEGVAYKVSHNDDYYNQSEIEVEKLGFAWSRGSLAGCRLPRFHHYRVADNELIVAMEVIKGPTLYECGESVSPDGVYYYDLLRDIEHEYRLCDMHDENAIVDEKGLLVPVDFGG